jgi:hypothetical protein
VTWNAAAVADEVLRCGKVLWGGILSPPATVTPQHAVGVGVAVLADVKLVPTCVAAGPLAAEDARHLTPLAGVVITCGQGGAA